MPNIRAIFSWLYLRMANAFLMAALLPGIAVNVASGAALAQR